MDDIGFLERSSAATPTTVRLLLRGDGDLVLVFGDGTEDRVPFRRLYRAFDRGPELHLGRRGMRNWRLTAGGATADALRRKVPVRWRRVEWGAARLWHVAIFIASILAIELVKMPTEWIAPLVPRSFEARLIPADLRGQYDRYCTSPEGEAAIRRLIHRLDPDVAARVRIEVLTEGRFLMTALPDDRLVIYKPFLSEVEPDEFAALVAHEVAHLKRRDAVEAVLRADGTFGAFLGTLFRREAPDWFLEFSPEQETAADHDALVMLALANISPLPGAALFEKMETARQHNDYFGKDQYYLHYGYYPDRAKRWRDTPNKGELMNDKPAFTPDEENALFNYCWQHTGPPRNRYPLQPTAPPRSSERG